LKRVEILAYENLFKIKAEGSLEGKFRVLEEISMFYSEFQKTWEICAYEGNRNIFSPKRGMLELRKDADEWVVSAILGRSIRNLFAPYVKNYLILHGGAVERNGKAVLFLGGHASGKSTIVSGFCKNSWNYLSEDMIKISLRDFKVYPSPPVSNKLREFKVGRISEISAIYMIKFVGGDRTRIENVEPYEVFLYITQNSVNPQVFDAKVFSEISRILRNVPLYRTFHASWEDVFNHLSKTS
jgi:hypothetical protein